MSNKGITITFKPHAKQEEAWDRLMDDTTRFVGYGGAARGGKTYLMCYWLVIMCVGYPGVGYGLCRKNITVLKKTTLLTLFKVFKECNITSDDYSYNQQLSVITFYNGSQIFLIDLDFKPSDPLFTDLGGYELTGAAVDESVELIPTAITILNTRVGWRKNAEYGIKPKILEVFNPAKNHVYTRYYSPYVKKELKPSVSFTVALPSDNPSPEVEEFIKGVLEEGDQVTIQRLLYGNFDYDDDPLALIPYDKIESMFSNQFVQEGRKCMTVDAARMGGDRIVSVVWNGWRARIYWWRRVGLDVSGARIEKLRMEYHIPANMVLVDDDGLGGGLVDFNKYKGFVNNARPMLSPEGGHDPVTGKRIPENYVNLKSQCGYRFANRVNALGVFVEMCGTPEEIRDGEELLKQDLSWLKKDKNDNDGKKGLMKKDVIKQNLGRSPDFADALIMREFFELKPTFVVTADVV